MDGLLYFAYGSNLDLDGKLSEWAPSARLFGIGAAPRRRLAFTRRSTRWGARAADILPHATATTWGALFRLDPEDVAGIDACEGAPRNYRRITIPVATETGERTAFSYEVVDRHLPEAPPAPEYMNIVLRGARVAGLPQDWITYLEGIPTA
jgi:hypothetical protein